MPLRLFCLWLLLWFPLAGAERIVAMSPAIAEIVYALGEGDHVVGVSEYAIYPDAVKSVEKIGGFFQSDIEKIYALEPDLIIAQPYDMQTVTKLEALKLQTMVVRLDTLKNIKRSILRIAETLKADAQPLIAPIETAIASVPKTADKRRVLIVFGLSRDLGSGIYVSGHDIYFEDILHLCGARNAYTQNFTGQPVLTYEQLLAIDPDAIIILNAEGEPDAQAVKKAQAFWNKLPLKAAKAGRIHVLHNPAFSIPSQRVATTITALCKAVAND